MADRSLKKLKREELLEMLVESERKNKELTDELEEAYKVIDLLEKEMESKKLELSESGSIAEASLRISGVFESAQKAADIYFDNVKELARKMLEETKLQCEAMKNQEMTADSDSIEASDVKELRSIDGADEA